MTQLPTLLDKFQERLRQLVKHKPVEKRVEQKAFSEPSRYLAQKARLQCRTERLAELLGPTSDKVILDLGCGDGSISAALVPTNRITMVDNSPAMIEKAKRHAAKHVLAYLHDYAGPPADIVLCIGVLSHVPDCRSVLTSISRNLKPGGCAVVQISPAENWLNGLHRMTGRRWGHSYRPTSVFHFAATAADCGLVARGERRHFLTVPGLQKLLGPRLKEYDRFVSRSRLSRFGTEHLILLEKAP